MGSAANVIWHGLRDAFLMSWEVWWALVLGFFISAVVQAWIPRPRVERAMAGRSVGSLARATGLGAASSSCSYAAVAIGKSLFEKGASAASTLAFQFASTNLVWELGLVLWVLIGWQFTLAEYIGGVVMIALMAILLRAFVSPGLESRAREHAARAAAGISFAGVIAFIFADLIVLPILLIYRKCYGTSFALRITGLMFVSMVGAALIIDALFGALGLIPHGLRPTRADVFLPLAVNYKLSLNLAALLVFGALFWLTAHWGATDPVCGMKVDRGRATTATIGGERLYFCSAHCVDAYVARGRPAERSAPTSSRGHPPAIHAAGRG